MSWLKMAASLEFSRKLRDLILASNPFLKFMQPKKLDMQGKVIRPNIYYLQKNITYNHLQSGHNKGENIDHDAI